MGLGRGKGAEASNLGRLSSVLRRQRATDPSDVLRLVPDDRQHAAEKEQVADLHGLDISAEGGGRRAELIDRGRSAAAPRWLARSSGSPSSQMCAAIDVQHLAGYAWRLCQEEDGIDDFLDAGDAADPRERLQEVLRVILVQRCVDNAGRHRRRRGFAPSHIPWRCSSTWLRCLPWSAWRQRRSRRRSGDPPSAW